MGKCKKENKDKKRVVTLPGSYMMTRTIPGPNYFIRVQLYTVKKKNLSKSEDKRSKNMSHPAIVKGSKAYLK